MTRSIRVLALLGFTFALAGCSSNGRLKTAVVSGKVTFNGKPVPNGTVLFIPETPGPTATGEIGPDGSYALTTYQKGDGAVLGKHKVVISAMEDTTSKLPEDRNPLPPSIVPDKYTHPTTSDLREEVEDKVNVKDIALTGELSGGKRKR